LSGRSRPHKTICIATGTRHDSPQVEVASMRLFVGIDIDREIRENIERFVSELKQKTPNTKFVSPQSYHVTLKFLGETTKVAEIRTALKKVEVKTFDITFRGTGFFPDDRHPRVF